MNDPLPLCQTFDEFFNELKNKRQHEAVLRISIKPHQTARVFFILAIMIALCQLGPILRHILRDDSDGVEKMDAHIEYQPSDIFSLCHNPIGGPPLTFWIAMTTWNTPAPVLRHSIESIARQTLSQWPYRTQVKVVLYERKSDKMLSDKDKSNFVNLVDVRFVAEDDCEGECEEEVGVAAEWKLFESIREAAEPNDYVFVLGSNGNMFADDLVIDDLSKMVVPKKPWFIWGKHNGGKHSEQCNELSDKDKGSPRGGGFRPGRLGFCLPRVFQAHLLQLFSATDFKPTDGGNWTQKSFDRPFISKMLEASGMERTHFFNYRKPMVNYTNNGNTGVARFSQTTATATAINQYKDMFPVTRTRPVVIHVIAAVYTRKNTHEFLWHLIQSVGPEEYVFHVCLNDLSRVDEMVRIAKQLSRTGRRIVIHPLGDNYGGFSRFLVARKIRSVENLEYMIMVDDDMLVGAQALSKIWKQRAPLSYSCFYGKAWDTIANSGYWHPITKGGILGVLEGALSLKKIKEWHYGGTGCSIVDAVILDDERLFQIPSRFLFVEDLWLSYVVALNGWKIHRLHNIQFKLDMLSESGQWQGLRETKREMFDGMWECPYSLVGLLERLVSRFQ